MTNHIRPLENLKSAEPMSKPENNEQRLMWINHRIEYEYGKGNKKCNILLTELGLLATPYYSSEMEYIIQALKQAGYEAKLILNIGENSIQINFK